MPDASPAGEPLPHDYPVVLDLRGQPCLVVGGGPVAGHKARGLLGAGARVTLVAPRVHPSVETLGHVEIRRRVYAAGEAAGYALVVTATGDQGVDGAVVADARSAGVMVNSADAHAPGSVQVPAVLRVGAVTVAVSTGGTSPALARWLRDRIAAALPVGTATVAELLAEARARMAEEGRPTGDIDWQAALDQVVPLVGDGRVEEARAALAAACSTAPIVRGPADR